MVGWRARMRLRRLGTQARSSSLSPAMRRTIMPIFHLLYMSSTQVNTCWLPSTSILYRPMPALMRFRNQIVTTLFMSIVCVWTWFWPTYEMHLVFFLNRVWQPSWNILNAENATITLDVACNVRYMLRWQIFSLLNVRCQRPYHAGQSYAICG